MKVAIPVIVIMGIVIAIVVGLYNSSNSTAPVDLYEKGSFHERARAFERLLKAVHHISNNPVYEIGEFGSFICTMDKSGVAQTVKDLQLQAVTELTPEERALTELVPTLQKRYANPAETVKVYRGTDLKSDKMPFDFVLLYNDEANQDCSFLLGYHPPIAGSTAPPKRESAVVAVPEKLLARATTGDAEAQFQAGELYARQETPAQDKTAAQWYEKAANQGHSEAQYNLGKLYLSGRLGKDKKEDARHWLEKARDQGNKLARLTIEQQIISGNFQGDREALLKEKANTASDQSKVDLAEYYMKKADYNKAMIWYKQAADKGDLTSTLALAKLHEKRGEFTEAKKLYQTAAGYGSYTGLIICGDLCLKEHQYQQAAEYFRKAVLADKSSLGTSRSRMLPETECLKVDAIRKKGELEKAATLYRQIAIRRHEEAERTAEKVLKEK
ncbi:MAG: sel1 repeat family protein [Candidatus Obscuribacter sp.]|nr:sel1 repeat family protein [Candidatus Obscuribacter sp.]